YSGLSVDVAKYVALVLGYGDEQLFFYSQTPATRLDRLDDGSVDFAMVTFAYDGGKNALEMDHTQTADGTR
ncbi:ABC transporter substrate-binding protein, partial [Bifidobacterium sp. MSK23_125]|nr:ABC transporter substrate-binding protein [Bifidobacterium sp. MSK23_125]